MDNFWNWLAPTLTFLGILFTTLTVLMIRYKSFTFRFVWWETKGKAIWTIFGVEHLDKESTALVCGLYKFRFIFIRVNKENRRGKLTTHKEKIEKVKTKKPTTKTKK